MKDTPDHTKAGELQLLREFIDSMGPRSYVGQWLASEYHCVELDIQSDHPISASISETRKVCHRLTEEANECAEGMKMEANAYRQAILKSASESILRVADSMNTLSKRIIGTEAELRGLAARIKGKQ